MVPKTILRLRVDTSLYMNDSKYSDLISIYRCMAVLPFSKEGSHVIFVDVLEET